MKTIKAILLWIVKLPVKLVALLLSLLALAFILPGIAILYPLKLLLWWLYGDGWLEQAQVKHAATAKNASEAGGEPAPSSSHPSHVGKDGITRS